MKKFLVFSYAMGFLFGLFGIASAILFTDTASSNITLTEATLEGLILPNRCSYSHDTLDDLGVPSGYVNSVTSTIPEYRVDANDDHVEIGGLGFGSLNEGGGQVNRWSRRLDALSDTYLDINSIFVSTRNVGDSLNVMNSAIGSWGDWNLELAPSSFTLDYTDNYVSFSEPATMLLIGFGLIGLASYGRKKFFKKALGSKRLRPDHGL